MRLSRTHNATSRSTSHNTLCCSNTISQNAPSINMNDIALKHRNCDLSQWQWVVLLNSKMAYCLKFELARRHVVLCLRYGMLCIVVLSPRHVLYLVVYCCISAMAFCVRVRFFSLHHKVGLLQWPYPNTI